MAEAFHTALADIMREVSAALKGADATTSAVWLLESLRFREMPMRHLEIPSTYGDTYTWIFDGSTTPFQSWLSDGNGIFWVSGKAGSGKSTLMKYLADHRETRRQLQGTSYSNHVSIFSFYFWNAGYPMQRSQQGMLQSLLFQLLKSHPGAMERACPLRWASEDRLHPPPWTRSEVVQSLETALQLLSKNSSFCLFIDGLDELAGEQSDTWDHYELVCLLERWTRYPHVKICVSSRPWNVFRKAYGTDQSRVIQLEDLTRHDMEIYVSGRLENDPRYRRLAQNNPDAHELTQEIHQRADGVFLWVFLVVRSLLLGLSDDDDIPTLQRRLRALPKDLRSWFAHMLSLIDETYQTYTARALLVACAAESPLPVLTFWHIEIEEQDQQYAMKAPIEPIQSDTYDAKLYKIRGTVNKWCRDLLEVRKNTSAKTSQALGGHKIDFLHRSVKDFLTEDETFHALHRQAGASFNPRLTLCRSFFAHCKGLTVDQDSVLDLPSYARWAKNVLVYAHACERVDDFCPWQELDELDRIGNIWSLRCGSRNRHWSERQSFRAFAQEHGLVLYLDHLQQAKSRPQTDHLQPGWSHMYAGVQPGSPGLTVQRTRSTERKRDVFKSMFSRSPRSSRIDLAISDDAYDGT